MLPDHLTGSDVTVVIPNYNGSGLLPATLEALEAQTAPGFAVVVVDNASTDDSLSVLERFPAVYVVALSANTGFAGGANIGVRASTTPLVAVLNSDARPDPGWMAALLHVANRAPRRVWALGSVLVQEDGAIESAGDAWSGTAAFKLLKDQPLSSLPTQPYEVFAVPGAAPLFRRSAFLDLGGYDEKFFLYYEDVDLSWRARLRGWESVVVPSARVTHVGSASSVGRRRRSRAWFHIARNSLWTAVRCPPEVHVRSLIRGTRRELHEARRRRLAAPYLAGRLVGLLTLPGQLRVRQRLQSSRTADLGRLRELLSRQNKLVPVNWLESS